MPEISARDAISFMTDPTHNQFFSVRFIKRTTGELRNMLCRYGVRSRLKGGQAAYNFDEKGLVCVWDTHKQDYRTIPKEALVDITINGEVFTVVYPPKDSILKEKDSAV